VGFTFDYLTCSATILSVPNELPRLPFIPHSKAGIECNGSIVSEEDGDNITLKCNQ